MKHTFYLLLILSFLTACGQKETPEPEKNNAITEVMSEDITKHGLPDPCMLLNEGIIRTEISDYSEEAYPSQFDHSQKVSTCTIPLVPRDSRERKYIRFSVQTDPMPDSPLKDRVNTLEAYEYVDGLGFHAAWNPNLSNLTFRKAGFALNMIYKDESKSAEERFNIVKNFSVQVAANIDEYIAKTGNVQIPESAEE